MDKAAIEQDEPGFVRLYLGLGPKLIMDPEPHLRAIENWAAALEGVFPAPDLHRSCATWSLPADERLVEPGFTTSEIQRRCGQALLDGADHVRHARPVTRWRQKVAAMILYPDMFMSEVQVFLDPHYYRGFERRAGQQVWTPLPAGRSLAAELNLAVPDGFVERGWLNTVLEDEAADQVFYQCEIWMIGEPVG